MFQALVLRLILGRILDAVFDLIIDAARNKVEDTSNTIDDIVVDQLEKNKELLKDSVREAVNGGKKG
jgi:hypothetical protein